MTLIERLRAHPIVRRIEIMDEAADRIEALETALREILEGHPDAFDLARVALAPEQDKNDRVPVMLSEGEYSFDKGQTWQEAAAAEVIASKISKLPPDWKQDQAETSRLPRTSEPITPEVTKKETKND